MAVEGLSISANDHILDLCAAPGGKLAICADFISHGRGTVTGVDINKKRLFTARSILKRLKLASRVRLVVHDGTTFCLSPPQLPKRWINQTQNSASSFENPKEATEEDDSTDINFTKPSNIRMLMNPPLLRQTHSQRDALYDKVLVDAECTHDASASHMQKYEGKPLPQRLLDSFSRGLELYELQFNLLTNGFRCLSPGGILIYSTCSAAYEQNEAIVLRFLKQVADRASLEYIPNLKLYPKGHVQRNHFQDLPEELKAKALKFDSEYRENREVPWTSGLFITRLRKIY